MDTTQATKDAQAAVDRESVNSILLPRYTRDALMQMGWQRSYGAPKAYRTAFMTAFADAWEARFAALKRN